MKDIIIYIAQVSLFLSIFFLIYKVFLQSTTFFKFNRIYLIIGLISAFILPFIRFSYDVPILMPLTEANAVTQNTVNTVVSPKNQIDIWTIMSALYLCGIIVFSIRNLVGYIKLVSLIKSGKIVKKDKYVLVDHEKVTSPFTAFKYIVLNTSKLSSTEQELILRHEITHVTQKHWFDLFCSQCALILQWFNPLTWLYISSLKENHEFLADKAVLDTGCSPTLYQAVLINQRFQGPVFSFTNSFNYSNHLKRLTMMKKMKSSPWKRLTVLTLIPALGTFFWVSATPNYVIQNLGMETNTATEQLSGYSAANEITKPVSDSINVTGYIFADNDSKDSVEISGTFSNSSEEPSMSFIDASGEVDLAGITSSITTISGNNTTIDSGEQIKIEGPFPSGKQPLYIVDGKEVSDIQNLDPKSIESISVLKDKTATEIYGEKGKNGVVIIELKKKDKDGNYLIAYSGKVIKAGTAEGISMVAVTIKGINTGTLTDANGNYSIETSKKDPILIFSNSGYKKQELKASKSRNIIYLETE